MPIDTDDDKGGYRRLGYPLRSLTMTRGENTTGAVLMVTTQELQSRLSAMSEKIDRILDMQSIANL